MQTHSLYMLNDNHASVAKVPVHVLFSHFFIKEREMFSLATIPAATHLSDGWSLSVIVQYIPQKRREEKSKPTTK